MAPKPAAAGGTPLGVAGALALFGLGLAAMYATRLPAPRRT
jgi:hypothetical protein